MAIRTGISRRQVIQASLLLGTLPWRSVWAAACMPAVTNILGPAYRSGAPFRKRLRALDEPGTPLTMRGTVTDAGDCSVLRGCTIDVWQVDAHGDYDMTGSGFHLRGKFKTDAQGQYAFDTILPVPYGMRPKHIHYLITHRGYEPRITQCYFEGDERNSKDPYVKHELIIAPTPTVDAQRRQTVAGTFDIALVREQPPAADAAKIYRDYVGTYEVAPGVTITIRATGNKLFWHLSAAENEGDALDGQLLPRAQGRFFVPEYDFEVTFVRNEHGQVDHVLDSRGMLSKKIG
jgi:protocatechuate 3,4-dioxygenase beta subunit